MSDRILQFTECPGIRKKAHLPLKSRQLKVVTLSIVVDGDLDNRIALAVPKLVSIELNIRR